MGLYHFLCLYVFEGTRFSSFMITLTCSYWVWIINSNGSYLIMIFKTILLFPKNKTKARQLYNWIFIISKNCDSIRQDAKEPRFKFSKNLWNFNWNILFRASNWYVKVIRKMKNCLGAKKSIRSDISLSPPSISHGIDFSYTLTCNTHTLLVFWLKFNRKPLKICDC
jgi:hypothetical protein